MPANAQPIANGFHPEAVPIIQPPPTSMVYSNPVATSELPEVNEPDKSRQEGEVKFLIGHFKKREENWSRNRNCFRDRYWWRAGQLFADFFPVTVPVVFAKVNSSQFPSKFLSGELGVTALLLNEYPGGLPYKVSGILIGKLKLNPQGRPMWVWRRLKLTPKYDPWELGI